MSLVITVLDHVLAAVGCYALGYRVAVLTVPRPPKPILLPPHAPTASVPRGKVYRIVTDKGVVHYDGRNRAEAKEIWSSVELNPGPHTWTFTIDGTLHKRRVGT